MRVYAARCMITNRSPIDVDPLVLVALITSVDCVDTVDALVSIRSALEGTSQASLRRILEDRESLLADLAKDDLAKDGAARPDPALTHAAQSLLSAVRTALGVLRGEDARSMRTAAGFQKLFQIATEVAGRSHDR